MKSAIFLILIGLNVSISFVTSAIVARDDADMTLVHRAGFKQEHWGDLTQAQAVALAHEMAEAINSANVEASEPPTRGVASTESANGGSLR